MGLDARKLDLLHAKTKGANQPAAWYNTRKHNVVYLIKYGPGGEKI